MRYTILKLTRIRYGTSLTVGKKRAIPGDYDKFKICRVTGVPDDVTDEEVKKLFQSFTDLPLEMEYSATPD